MEDFSQDQVLQPFPLVDGYPSVDEFLITRRLGQGGMGVVYRAFDTAHRREVAIKFVLPNMVSSDSAAAFLGEAERAKRVDHKNTVRVYGAKESNEAHRLYIVMELVQGETLKERISRTGPLGFNEALTVMAEAAEGLAAIHDAGLVHRDIKPDNLLVTRDGCVKVSDFGLARSFDGSRLSGSFAGLAGTPVYMSPEHFLTPDRVSPSADIWSLGATLFYALAGQSAIKGKSLALIGHQVCSTPFPDLRDFRGDCPSDIVDLVAKCTTKNPAERPPSALATSRLLRALVDGEDQKSVAIDNNWSLSLKCADIPPPSEQTIRRVQRLRAGVPAWQHFVLRWRFLLASVLVVVVAVYAIKGGESSEVSESPTEVHLPTPTDPDSSTAANNTLPVSSEKHQPSVLPTDAHSPEDLLKASLDSVIEMLEQDEIGLALDELDAVSIGFTTHHDVLRVREQLSRAIRRDFKTRLQVLEPKTDELGLINVPSSQNEFNLRVSLPRYHSVVQVSIDGSLPVASDASAGFTFLRKTPPPGAFSIQVDIRLKTRPEIHEIMILQGFVQPMLDPLAEEINLARQDLQKDVNWRNGILRLLDVFAKTAPGNRNYEVAGVLLEDTLMRKWEEFDRPGRRIEGLQYARIATGFPVAGDAADGWRIRYETTLHEFLDRAIRFTQPVPDATLTFERPPKAKEVLLEFEADLSEGKLGVSINGQIVPVLAGKGKILLPFTSEDAGSVELAVWFEECPEIRQVHPLRWTKNPSGTRKQPVKDPWEGFEFVGAVRQEGRPKTIRHKQSGTVLVLIKPGRFLRGAPESDDMARANEKPQRTVELTRWYYMARTEVTMAQFRKFRPGHCEGLRADGLSLDADDHPAVNVDWEDAVAWCESFQIPIRLPTEAEWEYAARGGTTHRFFWGHELALGRGFLNGADTEAQKHFGYDFAVFPFNDRFPAVAPVGRFKPNPFGLHDMLGNVFEWCSDRYGRDYYSEESSLLDPEGPTIGDRRVARGGAWSGDPRGCRVSRRNVGSEGRASNAFGFRPAFTAPPPSR